MAWHLLKKGDEHNISSEYMEFLIDSTTDINSPPQNYSPAPGSLAHTPGFTHVYEAGSDGTWTEIGG